MRFKTGQVAVTGAAQQITSADGEYSAYVLKARELNVAAVALGDSTVTVGTGYLLEPGETFTYGTQVESGEPVFDVKLQDLYVVGTLGDTVSWLAHKV